MNGHSVFRVLGPLEVIGELGEPVELGGKPAILLAKLLLHGNEWVGTDVLIDTVWAGREIPDSAHRNLKTYVWQLRRVLPQHPSGLSRIESRPAAYRLRVALGELDSDLAARASGAEAVDVLREALALWRGRPYDGLDDPIVTRLTELRWSLRENLADALLAGGRSAEAVAELRALTADEPLRELAWAKLMTALHRSGRRHEALSAYQQIRTALVRELGIEPGAELTTAHATILANPAPRVVRNLPRALPELVGRDHELVLLNQAEPGALITVDGMPGIGKSSLVIKAAHQMAQAFPDGTFHLDLGTHRSAVSAFEALGRLIKAAGGSAPDSLDARTSYWRSLTANRRILLVLDDVADAAQVRALATPTGLTLVTSRARLTGADATLALTLDVLAPRDALRILAGLRASLQRVALARCAGHPGALRLLAERLRGRSDATITRLLTNCQHDLPEVLATFDASYQRLPAHAQQVYRALSRSDVVQDADLLLDANLVTEIGPGQFTAHPLIQAHASLMRPTGRLELVPPGNPRVA